jgi:hypothetical protein
MVDPGTGLTILGSAIGGAKVVEKILGPTADYVGVGLKSWAEKRVENARKIFGKTAAKLGDRIDQPGAISPKVLKEVLDEGSYCDDDLTAEYFGGVLASARSDLIRDDRAATYLKLTASLSTYQIRFHYIYHLALRRLFLGSGMRPTYAEDREEMWLYLTRSFLMRAMDFDAREPAEDILIHCIFGLERHGLLEAGSWGTPTVIEQHRHMKWKRVTGEGGFTAAPSQFGMEYWLWAVGANKTSPSYFLGTDLHIPYLPSAVVLDELPEKLVSEVYLNSSSWSVAAGQGGQGGGGSGGPGGPASDHGGGTGPRSGR